MQADLITLQYCRIENAKQSIIKNISWCMKRGEVWLVTGANASGKDAFLAALAGKLRIVSNKNSAPQAVQDLRSDARCTLPQSAAEHNQHTSHYNSVFGNSVELVSLERAALIIQEERENDESDYIEGGVDIGRTGRIFIAEAIARQHKKRTSLCEIAKRIESFPEIKLCGVEKILDRGLKYMSTGEIRRTLLARSLVSGKKLLILSDPFAGLDAESRAILQTFFNTLATRQLASSASKQFPHIILGMERYHEIPDAVSHVLEFCDNAVSFCGTRHDYEALLAKRTSCTSATHDADKAVFTHNVLTLQNEAKITRAANSTTGAHGKTALVEMRNVNVGWDNHRVLVNLNWNLYEGEHWLIRGPNGSGKTTFLELITGDNMQVYCNDVRVFGKRRGTGETMWDIKARLGIVSYRLHVEYRMVASTSLLNVLVSGFKDSIGLYEKATGTEITAARKWLSLGGFAERESEPFSSISYGEQRALLILRAAVKCPPVLVLDEPCHALDENYRQKILDLLEAIAASGTTTLLHVTHENDEALACEKHILELRPGETPMYKIITR